MNEISFRESSLFTVPSDEDNEVEPSARRKDRRNVNWGGGRYRKRESNLSLKKKEKTNLLGLLTPLFVLLIISNFLFGEFWGSDDTSYYYYQSSYYESSTYGADGKVDTARKESIRTNIPSLLENRPQSVELDSRFDREMDDGIDRLTRFERSMIGDLL
eukprot:CAMPEP_0198145534 /NCGR_PEP_ID=MMETSP1443-20131203/24209_1 /TAXON_ID=186043 /ORGANISM="Entomoneis sp., Strain CCMP2396" /LENGTH=158 /DNA_ID=CAMNT_0043809221 /DNA_START=138 /DNA_END=614 /DNA_ORIENTATION=+